MGLKVLHGQELHRGLFDFRKNINFLSVELSQKYLTPPVKCSLNFQPANYRNIFWVDFKLKIEMCIP